MILLCFLLSLVAFGADQEPSPESVKPPCTAKNKLCEPRSDFATYPLKSGKIFVYGGYKDRKQGYRGVSEIYDPNTGESKLLATQKVNSQYYPFRIFELANESILFVSNSGHSLYDMKNNLWQRPTNLKTSGPRIFQLNDGRLIFVEGESQNFINEAQVEVKKGTPKIWDPATNELKELPKINNARLSYFFAQSSNGDIWVLGGGTQSGKIELMYECPENGSCPKKYKMIGSYDKYDTAERYSAKNGQWETLPVDNFVLTNGESPSFVSHSEFIYTHHKGKERTLRYCTINKKLLCKDLIIPRSFAKDVERYKGNLTPYGSRSGMVVYNLENSKKLLWNTKTDKWQLLNLTTDPSFYVKRFVLMQDKAVSFDSKGEKIVVKKL